MSKLYFQINRKTQTCKLYASLAYEVMSTVEYLIVLRGTKFTGLGKSGEKEFHYNTVG